MAEYFNQLEVRVQEMAIFQFNHVINEDNIDVISYILCNVELLPHLSKMLQDTYDSHKAKMAEYKAARETNKSLS